MANSDYYLCDNCECKTFYDADLSYMRDNENPHTGHMWPDGNVGYMEVLCTECAKLPSLMSRLRVKLTAKDAEIASLREALEAKIPYMGEDVQLILFKSECKNLKAETAKLREALEALSDNHECFGEQIERGCDLPGCMIRIACARYSAIEKPESTEERI